MVFGTASELSPTTVVASVPLLLSSLLLAHVSAPPLSSYSAFFEGTPFGQLSHFPALFYATLAPLAITLSILSIWIELSLSLYVIATSRAEAMQLADVARQVASRLPPELVSRIMKPHTEQNSTDAMVNDSRRGGVAAYMSLAEEVAHQSRTYETNSSGFIQMLLDTNITSGQEELILNLQQSIAYSSRLLQLSILYFKADAGLLSLDMSHSFDCQHLFDLTLSEQSVNLEDNINVNVVRRVDPDFPHLYGDTAFLSLILKNLLDNAAKFTLQGSITLSARVIERSWATQEESEDSEASSEDGSGTNAEYALVEFGVSDTGCGIPAAQLALIKTPFATKSEIFWTPQMTKGAGLGIPTADAVARCFPDGHLDVESTENVGTSFKVQFRLKIDSSYLPEEFGFNDPSSAFATSAPALLTRHPPASPERRSHKIAIFATEPTFASLAGMLIPHGFQVKHFLSRGNASIDLVFEIRQAMLQRDPFKAVLIDAHAYGSSHHHLERIFSLATHIRSDPVNASTPLALVIHAGLFAGKIAHEASVFDECILKPLLCQQVLLSISRLLSGYGETPFFDPRFITSGESEAEESYEAATSPHVSPDSSMVNLPSSSSSFSLLGTSSDTHTDKGYGFGIPADSGSMGRLRRHSVDASLSLSSLHLPLESLSAGRTSIDGRISMDGAEAGSSCSSHSTLGDLPEGPESSESSPRNNGSSDTTDSTSGRSTGEISRLDSITSTPPSGPPGRLTRRSRTTIDSATISAYQNWKEKSTRSTHEREGLPLPPGTSLSASASVSSPNVLPLTVLIIEDDKTNRLVLSKMVSHMDHRSLTAENGPEGLEIFKRNFSTIDLVIMDYRMPKMDGAQTTQAIRAFEAEVGCEAVPIIGLSADDSVRPKCIAAGMDNCWTKPLKSQTLQVYLVQRRMQKQNTKISRPQTSVSSSSIPVPRSVSDGSRSTVSSRGSDANDLSNTASYTGSSSPALSSGLLDSLEIGSSLDSLSSSSTIPNGYHTSKLDPIVSRADHNRSPSNDASPDPSSVPGAGMANGLSTSGGSTSMPPTNHSNPDIPRTSLLPPRKSSLRHLSAIAAASIARDGQSSAPSSPGRQAPQLSSRVQSSLGTSANTLLPTPSLVASKKNGLLLPISRNSPLVSASTPPELSEGDRILLVEDNLTVAKIAMTVLARNQQPVELATDGQEAFERISRDHDGFCVILMDIHLPRMNGFDSTRAIRAFEKDNGLAPLFIIALTGEMRFIDPEPYLSCGFNHFLRKPVNYQVLIAQLPQFRAHRAHLANPTLHPPGDFPHSLSPNPSNLIASSSTFESSAPGKREADSPELIAPKPLQASTSDSVNRHPTPIPHHTHSNGYSTPSNSSSKVANGLSTKYSHSPHNTD